MLVRLQRIESLCRKSLKFAAVAQLSESLVLRNSRITTACTVCPCQIHSAHGIPRRRSLARAIEYIEFHEQRTGFARVTDRRECNCGGPRWICSQNLNPVVGQPPELLAIWSLDLGSLAQQKCRRSREDTRAHGRVALRSFHKRSQNTDRRAGSVCLLHQALTPPRGNLLLSESAGSFGVPSPVEAPESFGGLLLSACPGGIFGGRPPLKIV